MSNELVKRSGNSGNGVVPAGQLINGESDRALGVFVVSVITGAGFLVGLPLIGGIFGLTHLATHLYAVGDAYIQGKKKR